MRIISDFKDYYDPLGRYDTDYETLYIRKSQDPIVVPLPKPAHNEYGRKFPSGASYTDYYYTPYYIIFCDQVYPLIERRNYGRFNTKTGRNDLTKIIYYYDRELARKVFGNWADYVFNLPSQQQQWFKRLQEQFGPIFLLRNQKNSEVEIPYNHCILVRNCRLKDFGFASIVPPAEAWTKLVKWHNNRARPEKKIPQMSNDTKIELAGFNTKSSFRRKKK